MKQLANYLLLIVFILTVTLQPLQVHALSLEAEQSGHVAGQLWHSHSDAEQAPDHHPSKSEPDHSDTEHTSPCHPSHIIFLPVAFDQHMTWHFALLHTVQIQALDSIDLSLDPPPPKLSQS